TPSRTRASNSPEARCPRRMKSSQTLCPSAKSCWIRLAMRSPLLRPPAAPSVPPAPYQHHDAPFRVLKHGDAPAVREIDGIVVERGAPGNQVPVGPVDVGDGEGERRLSRRPALLLR